MHPTVRIDGSGETTPLLRPGDGSKTVKQTAYVYLAAMTGSVGGFLFGYDTGIISGAMIFIRERFDLSELWQEMIVSSTLLSAWAFCILSGMATSKLGRKAVIILSSVVFVVGSIVMAIAWNEYILLLGRLVVGAGVGFASTTVPMYIAELSPSHIRGQLVVLYLCSVTFGQFLASLVAYWFSFMPNGQGWRFMLALAAIPAAIQFFVLLLMPESPRWLVQKARYEEAKKVLAKLRPAGTDIEIEFQAIKKNCDEAREDATQDKQESSDGQEVSTFRRIIKTQPVRKALLVGCLLQVTAQLSGINSVMYYSASIFEMAGVHSKPKALLYAAVTAFINFAFTLVGLFLIERMGRRRLTLISLAGAIVGLLVLASGFQLAEVNSPTITDDFDAPWNHPCNSLYNCADCVQDNRCGFCYAEDPKLSDGTLRRSTCLHVDPSRHDQSSKGCWPNVTDFAKLKRSKLDFIWAYEWCPSSYAWLTLLGMAVYLLSFAPGMGPTPWTINSEIYPSWARSWCQACSASVCWLFNLLVSMTFLSLSRAISKHGAFYLYAMFASLGLIYFIPVLPETRSKSLEELEDLFASKEWKEKKAQRGQRQRERELQQQQQQQQINT